MYFRDPILIIMKAKLLLAAGLLSSFYSTAQDTARVDILLLKQKTYKNTVTAELGGPGGLYTLSYERALLTCPPRFQLFAQAGGAYNPDGYKGYAAFYLMIKGSYQVHNGHYAELGLGYMMDDYVTSRFFNDKASLLYSLKGGYLATRLGYRYQKYNSPWSYRASFTPLYLLDRYTGSGSIKWENERRFLPWGSIGIGYSF